MLRFGMHVTEDAGAFDNLIITNDEGISGIETVCLA